MQTENDCPDAPPARPHWLRVLVMGRRPKVTLWRALALSVVCFVIFRFILMPVRIDGISMEPAYHDRHVNLVNRLAYRRHEPQRGDVVAVRFSDAGPRTPSILLLKRIIGLPGETVAFHEGRVYINGQLLEEPYVKLGCDWEREPVLCGPTEYFVVGDNRSMPFESHTKGRADRRQIIGKAML